MFNSQSHDNDPENSDQVTWDKRIEMKQHLHHVYGDLSQINVNSDDFKALPPEIQHEILLEVKASFKSYSMIRMDDMPQESKEFSTYQLSSLMQRSKLTRQIDNVRRQLNTSDSGDIQDMFDLQSLESRRVVSEDDTHYLLLKNQPQRDDHLEYMDLQQVSNQKDTAHQATNIINTSSTPDQLSNTLSKTTTLTTQTLQDDNQSDHNTQIDSIKVKSQLDTTQSVDKEENNLQVQVLSDINKSDSQQLQIKVETTSIADSQSVESAGDEIKDQHEIPVELGDEVTSNKIDLKFVKKQMSATSKDDFKDEIVITDDSKNVAIIESSSESEGIKFLLKLNFSCQSY